MSLILNRYLSSAVKPILPGAIKSIKSPLLGAIKLFITPGFLAAAACKTQL